MKAYSLFLIFITLNSCQFFDKKIPSEEELLKKELKLINWNEVDEYPSMNDCDKIDNKTQRKQCFFELLTQLIQEKLDSYTLTPLLKNKVDTLNIEVTIFSNSKLQFKPIFSKKIVYDTIKIDSLLQNQLINFPKINPAIKRDIPVKSKFILPVILKKAP